MPKAMLNEPLIDFSFLYVFPIACAVLATYFSLRLIRHHLAHYNSPLSQRCVVRIIALVPVYALSCIFELIFPQHDLLFSTLRSGYEGFALYQFFSLLVLLLGGESLVIATLGRPGRPDFVWPWPLPHLGCKAVKLSSALYPSSVVPFMPLEGAELPGQEMGSLDRSESPVASPPPLAFTPTRLEAPLSSPWPDPNVPSRSTDSVPAAAPVASPLAATSSSPDAHCTAAPPAGNPVVGPSIWDVREHSTSERLTADRLSRGSSFGGPGGPGGRKAPRSQAGVSRASTPTNPAGRGTFSDVDPAELSGVGGVAVDVTQASFATASWFYRMLKRGTLQFMLVKPVTAVIALVCTYAGVFDASPLPFCRDAPNATTLVPLEGVDGGGSSPLHTFACVITSLRTVIVIVDNLSIACSLFFLVGFALALQPELRRFNPLPKFLCIKGVLFASYWQYIILLGLQVIGALPAGVTASKLQAYLMCIELLPAAMFYRRAFHHSDVVLTALDAPPVTRKSLLGGVRDIMSPRDVVRDVASTMLGVGRTRGTGIDAV